MGTTREQIKAAYPLPAYNYRVDLDAETTGFAEVTGLSAEVETITYRHGLSWREGPVYMPGMPKPVNLSLKKGMVKGGSKLYEWFSSIELNKVSRKDITVHLCDEQGKPVVSWKVLNAFPVKLEAPSFSAKGSEVAIESISLMASSIKMEFV